MYYKNLSENFISCLIPPFELEVHFYSHFRLNTRATIITVLCTSLYSITKKSYRPKNRKVPTPPPQTYLNLIYICLSVFCLVVFATSSPICSS